MKKRPTRIKARREWEVVQAHSDRCRSLNLYCMHQRQLFATLAPGRMLADVSAALDINEIYR